MPSGIPRKKSKGYYDEHREVWAATSKYDYDAFVKVLDKHFAKGGGFENPIIAGKIGVSRQTIERWKSPNNNLFKSDFCKYLEEKECLSIARLDEANRASAMGELPLANATILKQRSSHYLGMNDKIETVNTNETKLTVESVEELDAELAIIENELAGK